MRYFIALIIAFLLIVGMFVFRAQMMGQIAAWEAANATISPIEKMLVRIAYLISRWWHVLAVVIVAACTAIAASVPGHRENQQPA